MTGSHRVLTDQAFRSTELLGRSYESTWSGALSFLRRRYSRDLEGVDVAVTGIPFDIATTNRPGARFGPAAIRAASVQLAELPAFPWNFDPFDTLAVVDYGDCFIDHGRADEIPQTIANHAREIVSRGVSMVSLGGDHFVTFPLLKAHAEAYGPLALVQFDAHQDTWSDDGRRIDHGTMFTRAVHEGLVDVDRSIQVGIRTHAPEDYGIAIVNGPDVHRIGPEAVIERILTRVGDGRAYLTFDIDCLDPSAAPGTGTPVAGGLSSAQALEILRGLGAIDFVGMDVVEVAPAYDHAGITAIAAATIAHDYLCLRALRKLEADT